MTDIIVELHRLAWQFSNQDEDDVANLVRHARSYLELANEVLATGKRVVWTDASLLPTLRSRSGEEG